MSLDVYLACDHCENSLYSANITHNLGKMADAAGIYGVTWRPEENGITKAFQLIEPLQTGLTKLLADPDEYRKHDSPNGWGLYQHFVPFVSEYLEACRKYSDATVRASR